MVGTLFVIGGAEAKLRRRTVLGALVAAAGGTEARIAVVSSASSLGNEVVEVYKTVFTSLGAHQIISLRPESRAQAHDADLAKALAEVSGIFFTGGNQLKLSSFITGTPFGDAIKRAHEQGTVVGGTSAGASVLAEHMIAFGAGGATPKQRMSQLSAGLGLLPSVVIDQHFEQRNRYGRLLSLVAQSPSLLGLGVDEDTAAVIHNDSRLEVIGRGAVTVVDGQNMVSDAFVAKRTAPLLVSGAVLHVLPAGSQFNLATRALLAHKTALPDPEAVAAGAEEADLYEVPAELAAEGLPPAHYEPRQRSSHR
jgi:cyanophycinase